MKHPGRIQNGAVRSVNPIHPGKIIQVAGDVFFSLPRRYDLISRVYYIGEIQVVDVTGAVIGHSAGHVQPASEVYHGSFRMVFKIVCDLPDQMLAIPNPQS